MPLWYLFYMVRCYFDRDLQQVEFTERQLIMKNNQQQQELKAQLENSIKQISLNKREHWKGSFFKSLFLC